MFTYKYSYQRFILAFLITISQFCFFFYESIVLFSTRQRRREALGPTRSRGQVGNFPFIPSCPVAPFSRVFCQISTKRSVQNHFLAFLLLYAFYAQFIERFHSYDQQLCKFIGTKESVYIRKDFNSHRIGLVHQYGRRDVI